MQSPSNLYKTGDFIVGSYSVTGKKLTSDTLVGDEAELLKKENALKKIALSAGATPVDEMSNPQKKGRKKPKSEKTITVVTPIPQEVAPAQEMKQVIFEGEFGTFTLNVTDIDVNDFGVALCFANKSDILFQPKPAQLLTCKVGSKTYNVMYAGMVFKIDGKFIMILVIDNR